MAGSTQTAALDKLIQESEDAIRRLEDIQKRKSAQSTPILRRISQHFHKNSPHLLNVLLAGSVLVVALGRLGQKHEYQVQCALGPCRVGVAPPLPPLCHRCKSGRQQPILHRPTTPPPAGSAGGLGGGAAAPAGGQAAGRGGGGGVGEQHRGTSGKAAGSGAAWRPRPAQRSLAARRGVEAAARRAAAIPSGCSAGVLCSRGSGSGVVGAKRWHHVLEETCACTGGNGSHQACHRLLLANLF